MDTATLVPEFDDETAFQKRFILSLSKPQRRVLQAHGVGRIPIEAGSADHNVCKGLKARHLITFDRHNPPKYTEATEAGRGIIAAMLAAEADALLEHLEP